VEDCEKALPVKRIRSRKMRIAEDFMAIICDLRRKILPNNVRELR
jgi:hypothetical protein